MSDDKKKYRLVTRSDFDGLVCAVLFKELGMIDDIKFVHPKDMQDGVIDVTENDITTNLPYVAGAYMAFDHHLSETLRLDQIPENYITDPDAPSAARVVYDYYGGKEGFPNVSVDMMEAVDKGDSAQLSEQEILKPTGWVLLNYLMDARTGLGRFRHFRISNYQLMMELIDMCRTQDIEDILYNPDVRERVVEYLEQSEPFKEQLKRCAKIDGNVVVLDLRDEETIHVGNRFMIYALFPETNVSVHVIWGLRQQNTVFAIGKSITNRTCKTNIGALCLEYGGGGHENAGTMQVENDQVPDRMAEVVGKLKAAG